MYILARYKPVINSMQSWPISNFQFIVPANVLMMPGPREPQPPGEDHLGLEDGGGQDLGEEVTLTQELGDKGMAPIPGGHRGGPLQEAQQQWNVQESL